MTKESEQLLKGALNLDATERAELAVQIIASLDGEPDDDVESAWAAEVKSRAKRARSGKDAGRPWPEVKKQLRDKLPPR